MQEPLRYTSSLTGQEIDDALLLAISIGRNKGIPIGQGNGLIRMAELIGEIHGESESVPTAGAVLRAISAYIALAKIIKPQGSVASEAALPENAKQGDAYLVAATGHLYVWNGERWADFGEFASLVQSVCGVMPDGSGNIPLNAGDVGAMPAVATGEVGQPLVYANGGWAPGNLAGSYLTDGSVGLSKIANQGAAKSGQFVAVAADGSLTTVELARWNGGSY